MLHFGVCEINRRNSQLTQALRAAHGLTDNQKINTYTYTHSINRIAVLLKLFDSAALGNAAKRIPINKCNVMILKNVYNFKTIVIIPILIFVWLVHFWVLHSPSYFWQLPVIDIKAKAEQKGSAMYKKTQMLDPTANQSTIGDKIKNVSNACHNYSDKTTILPRATTSM